MSRKKTSKQRQQSAGKSGRKVSARTEAKIQVVSAAVPRDGDSGVLSEITPAERALAAARAVSVELFIALPEEEPTTAPDDPGEFMGEIFVQGARVGNDVALDMETLQPVPPTQGRPPVISMGPTISIGTVRELLAEFDEDVPTILDPRRYPWTEGADLPATAAVDAGMGVRYATPVTGR